MQTDLQTAEVEISLSATESNVMARASLDVPGRRFEAAATAPQGIRSTSPEFARDLAIARVLRALEAELMHSVHERIDRFTGN
jgi:hypothetical protein